MKKHSDTRPSRLVSENESEEIKDYNGTDTLCNRNVLGRPSPFISKSELIKDYDGADTFGLEFSIINRRLPNSKLDFVRIKNLIKEDTLRIIKQFITPFVLIAVAVLIHILENPVVLAWIAPVVWCILTLFCWCYQLNKWLWISLLLSEKVRLESILLRREVFYGENTKKKEP